MIDISKYKIGDTVYSVGAFFLPPVAEVKIIDKIGPSKKKKVKGQITLDKGTIYHIIYTPDDLFSTREEAEVMSKYTMPEKTNISKTSPTKKTRGYY